MDARQRSALSTIATTAPSTALSAAARKAKLTTPPRRCAVSPAASTLQRPSRAVAIGSERELGFPCAAVAAASVSRSWTSNVSTMPRSADSACSHRAPCSRQSRASAVWRSAPAASSTLFSRVPTSRASGTECSCSSSASASKLTLPVGIVGDGRTARSHSMVRRSLRSHGGERASSRRSTSDSSSPRAVPTLAARALASRWMSWSSSSLLFASASRLLIAASRRPPAARATSSAAAASASQSGAGICMPQ